MEPVSCPKNMTFYSRYPWLRFFGRLMGQLHRGIDYICKVGTPIKAPHKMQQSKVFYKNNPHQDYGYAIYAYSLEVKGLEFIFGHLDTIAWPRVGKIVKKGEVFAWTGGDPKDNRPGDGISTANHLHFEARLNGVKVDPLKYT